jgi:hypothetical protein
MTPQYTRDELMRLAAQAAMKHGIDPDIYLAQIAQESGFNPTARSKAGAQGIAQFMPGTAAQVGLKNPWDPVEALDAGARHMADLQQRLGSPALALAGYNAGATAVQKAGGIPNSAETQDYVKRITEASQRNREQQLSASLLQGQQLAAQAQAAQPAPSQATLPPDWGGNLRLPPQAGGPRDMTRQRDPMWGLAQNPWLQIGLGILSNPQGANGNAFAGIAGGIQSGMANVQQARMLEAKLRPEAPEMSNFEKEVRFLVGTGMPMAEAIQTASKRGSTNVNVSPSFAGPQVSYGGVGSGNERILPGASDTAGVTRPTEAPLPGTKEAAEREISIGELDLARGNIAKLSELFKAYGPELSFPGSNTAVNGQMAQLYAAIVANIAKLRGMGVLQPGELENIERALPDPTSVWAQMPGQEQKLKAALSELDALFSARRDMLYRAYYPQQQEAPGTAGLGRAGHPAVPPPGMAPPSATQDRELTPEEKAEYDRLMQMKQRQGGG